MEILEAVAAQQRELSDLLDGMSDGDWSRPTRCEGWDVSDVVLHLAQTNEMATGSATGRFAEAVAELTDGIGPTSSVDDGAALMVARQRGLPPATVRARWEQSAVDLRDALAACDPHERVDWVVGQIAATTLATTRLAETWIHTGDVADGLGVPLEPTDRLWHIARLAWRTLPYAFAQAGRGDLAGPVGFDLVGPGGDRWAFGVDDEPVTSISGPALDLCLVAARRVEPAATELRGDGPDADAVLELVRTYA